MTVKRALAVAIRQISLGFAISSLIVGPVMAAPTGGSHSHGSDVTVSLGSDTVVNQTIENATINWSSFNVTNGESVQFCYGVCGSSSNTNYTTLNLIGGNSVSDIDGAITSNGQVFFSNPNGIVFGANAEVNVGGLIATTANISVNNNTATLTGVANSTSEIESNGTINSSGMIAFIAPNIDVQGGTLTAGNGSEIHFNNATNGTITLSNGISFNLADTAAFIDDQQGVNNAATLISDGGLIVLDSDALNSVYSGAINNTGIINVNSLTGTDGDIQLIATAANGVIANSGDLQAGGATLNADIVNLTGSNDLDNLNNLILEDVNQVNSSVTSLAFSNLQVNGDTTWNANTDLAFDTNTDLQAFEDSTSSLSFDSNNNDLTLGSIEFFLANNEAALAVSFQEVDTLTLQGSISTGGQDFDADTGVNSIVVTNPLTIETSGGDIRLEDITADPADNVSMNIYSHSADGLSGSDIHMQSISGVSSLVVQADDAINLNGNLDLDGNLEFTAAQTVIQSDLTVAAEGLIEVSGTIEGNGAANDLTLDTSGAIELSGIGASQGLGAIAVIAESTTSTPYIDFGGNVNAETLDVSDAAQVQVNQDTTFTLTGNSIANCNGTTCSFDSVGSELTGSGQINIVASGNVNLGSVDAANISVSNASGNLYLQGDINTFGTQGIDLSNAGTTILTQRVEMDAGDTGSVLLDDNIQGNFNLEVTVDQGNVDLGSQSSVSPLAGLTVIDEDESLGTTMIGSQLLVNGNIELANLGAITLSDSTNITSNNGSVNLQGSQVTGTSNDLTINATNGTNGRVQLGDLNVNSLTTVTGVDTQLNGDVVANQLLFGAANALTLVGDSSLTGNLDLGVLATNEVDINGNYQLNIDSVGNDLELFGIGDSDRISGIAVTNVNNLTLNQQLYTQGPGGISLAGNNYSMLADMTFDTSNYNSDIDLSQIDVNGPFTLTLNAGNGKVSVGDVGQTNQLVSLKLEDASTLELGGSINTQDVGFDVSFVQAVEIIDDTVIDTSLAAGAINFGDASIDGTYDLTLNSGAGAITLGEVGQNIALQTLTITTETDLVVDNDIAAVGDINITANSLTMETTGTSVGIVSTGEDVIVSTLADINMGSKGQIYGFQDVSLTSIEGAKGVALGVVTAEQGDATIIAEVGAITNAVDDFVSVTDTSVNVTAQNVTLTAATEIGTGIKSPIVIDAPATGTINLTFTADQAYIVNLGDSNVVSESAGVIYDSMSQGLFATTQSVVLADTYSDLPSPMELITATEASGPMYAVTQAGYVLPVNVDIQGGVLSSLIPEVPGLFQDKQGWSLKYAIASVE